LKPKTLEDILQEAIKDPGSTNLSDRHYETRMLLGVRIQKYNLDGVIKIFNPRGKLYPEELTDQEYELFDRGWRIGVYRRVIQGYEERLENIKNRIPQLLAQNKKIDKKRDQRENLMRKRREITNKLNQLL
tara:strand:+ start:1766 stop:2158 length:393 start_codon:yes stop_codon:yes gene_type:complete